MIDIKDKTKCCGCNSCVQKCPVNCISMVIDNEGFQYPVVDLDKCINCGLCEKVCPFLASSNSHLPLTTYAAKNKNVDRQKHSSSGGIFPAIANCILKKDGIVFGARFDDEYGVEHDYAQSPDDAVAFYGSKYVQSKIGTSYKQVEEFLKKGNTVLFSGTPCQIKGLKLFLRKDYDNLITIEVICHGVPSPKIWNDFISTIISDREPIANINFRDKTQTGYDWQKYGFVVKGSGNKVLFSEQARSTVFFKLFLTDLISRPSCYACNSKNGASGADITLGDLWGAQTLCPEFYDKNGVSLIIVHTTKGAQLLSEIAEDICYEEVKFDTAVAHNPSYLKPVDEPKERKKFWKYYYQNGNLQKSLNKSVQQPMLKVYCKAVFNKVLNVLNKK